MSRHSVQTGQSPRFLLILSKANATKRNQQFETFFDGEMYDHALQKYVRLEASF